MLPGQKNRCFFHYPHVGFRGMFFDLAAAAGSTDFGSDAEVKTLLDKFNSTADLYLQHNQHESELILPHMKPINAEEAAKWEADHAGAPKEDEAIRSAIQSVLDIEDHDARLLAGAKAYRLVTQSVAHHLEHMIYEETVIMDLFRTKLSDPEIDAIEAVVVKHLPPSMLQACTPIFIRYHNTQGRAYLLNIIKASAPPPAFAGVCGLAKSLLSAQEVESLEKALGFPLTA